MPDRDALVHEASELLVLYRDLARLAPGEVDGMGVAIGRALEALDLRETRETLDSAALQLAAVRETLARVRRTLDKQ